VSEIHKRISQEEIPLDPNGHCLIDLYVHLPSSRRYVIFVAKGDVYNEEKKERLKKFVLPDVFVLPSEFAAISKNGGASKVAPVETNEEFAKDVLGVQAQQDLDAIYGILLNSDGQDPRVHMMALQNSADKILALVAPESKEIKDMVLKNAKYLHLMNDASAITTLAVLFAFANGFDSRKSYLELTCASLVMDVALHGLSPKDKELSYIQFDQLSPETQKSIHNHPVKSHQLVSERIPNLSDVTMQLVLNHHELFNGKGYPRGIRSESLFPLVKILSLAVDVYETLKRYEILKEKKSLLDVICEFHEEKVDAHLRRHNRRLTDKILQFVTDPSKTQAA
jgi:hypothetical protein